MSSMVSKMSSSSSTARMRLPFRWALGSAMGPFPFQAVDPV
jgi:hypothetical protein